MEDGNDEDIEQTGNQSLVPPMVVCLALHFARAYYFSKNMVSSSCYLPLDVFHRHLVAQIPQPAGLPPGSRLAIQQYGGDKMWKGTRPIMGLS